MTLIDVDLGTYANIARAAEARGLALEDLLRQFANGVCACGGSAVIAEDEEAEMEARAFANLERRFGYSGDLEALAKRTEERQGFILDNPRFLDSSEQREQHADTMEHHDDTDERERRAFERLEAAHRAAWD